jgi:hypothetical protein
VRVDPEDATNIELDLTHDVPPSRGGGSANGAAPTTQVIEAGQGLPPDIAAQLAAAGIDLSGGAGAPPIRMSPVSGAEILATGTPCRAIIQSASPLGTQKDGHDVWGIVLNAIADGEPTTQARIGIGVPAAAMALVFPGSNLPARRRSDVEDGVCIDWDAATTGGT